MHAQEYCKSGSLPSSCMIKERFFPIINQHALVPATEEKVNKAK